MRFFAVGQEATGVIAVGQQATGIVAIGQLATGVVAIGQLAVGVVALGQLVIGLGWAAGMVGVGGTSGGLLVAAPFGDVSLRSMSRLRPELRRRTIRPWIIVPWLAAIALWVFVAALPLTDELTRPGGIFQDPAPTSVPGPPVLR